MITIDSTTYDVNIKLISRKPDALYKYAERTQDGVLQKEIIGQYFNYDVQCGMSVNNVTDYAALFLKITEPVEFHTITNMPGAPTGYESFECYFAGIKDDVAKWTDAGVKYFRNLSFSIIQRRPSRTP